MKFNFKTLTEFTDYFRNEKVCRDHFAAERFANGEYCLHCKHPKIYKFSGGKRYRCEKCRKDFTIKAGTIFGESRLPLRKWFMAIYLLTTSAKGISSVQLAKHLGVTQKTAWFVAHRIRESAKQDTAKLSGTCEADETYIGGKAKNMHRKKRREIFKGTDRGTANKIPLFGIKTRDGKIRTRVIPAVDWPSIHRAVLMNIKPGSTLYTDEHRAYNGLGKTFKRGVVQHGIGQYVNGDCHTNGIESYWSVFKRGYHGNYHWMSKKHLPRYSDEFAYRFNLRGKNMKDIFTGTLQRTAGTKKLSYKALTKGKI